MRGPSCVCEGSARARPRSAGATRAATGTTRSARAVAAVGALWAGVRLIVDEWLGESPTFINTAFISTGNVLLLAPWILLAAIVLAVVSSSFSLSKYTRV